MLSLGDFPFSHKNIHVFISANRSDLCAYKSLNNSSQNNSYLGAIINHTSILTYPYIDICSTIGLHFALEPSSVPPTLHLSNSSLTVTYKGENPPVKPAHDKVMRSAMASDPEVLQPFPQVRSDVVIARGQYYWEVDVCNSSMYRIGKHSF